MSILCPNELFLRIPQEIPVITDVFIHDSSSRERLENYICEIHSYIRKYEVALPSDISLVLEFRLSGRCGYYFVDHETQCLFWLDEFDAIVFLGLVRVKYTPPLVGECYRSLLVIDYWTPQNTFSRS